MGYTLYGIPNCDTIKKAKTWLDNKGVEYQFFNYKTNDIQSETIKNWLTQAPLDKVLNKASTTYRKLSDEEKSSIQQENQAIALMQLYPSMIKRPILVKGETVLAVGFKPEHYDSLF